MNFNSLLEIFLALAALPANQQANFLKLHQSDAASQFMNFSPWQQVKF